MKGVIDEVAKGLDWLSGLLPDWLTPGSPTPLELGLRGIGKELAGLAKNGLPKLSMGFDSLPAGSLLSGAGAVGGGAQIILQFTYAPLASFADDFEVETKMLPLLEKGIRRIVEQTRL